MISHDFLHGDFLILWLKNSGMKEQRRFKERRGLGIEDMTV